MPPTRLTTRLLTQATRTGQPIRQSFRLLSTTPIFQGKDSKMSSSPPKHELVYFPKLTSDVRAFGQFRKVLHTGLFSQLVSMEIPVGGDIGDEVHTVDQVLIFTSGQGKATVAGKDQVRLAKYINDLHDDNAAHRTSKPPTSLLCPLAPSTNSSTLPRLSRWSLSPCTALPSTTAALFTRPRKRAMKRRRMVKMKHQSGVSRAKTTTKSMAW